MSDSPSLVVTCPHCSVELNVPAAADLGQLKCPQCQEFLDGAVPIQSVSGPIPPHLHPDAGKQPMAPPPSPKPGFQLELDESDQRSIRPPQKGLGKLGIVASTISLGLFSLLVVASLMIRFIFPDWFTPETVTDTVSVQVVRGKYEPPSSWAPAPGKALRVGGLKVKVERIEIGPVLAKAGTQEIISSEDQNIMQVYISLENESEEPFDYTSWYGNEFVVGETTVSAKLTNSRQELYSMLVFEDVAGIYGHVPRAVIRGKETLQDSIVFELPSEKFEGEGPWRLELPQAAFGFSGSLGFELPESLVIRESALGSSPMLGNE